MTKREFVEQAAMRQLAAFYSEHHSTWTEAGAVLNALLLWDEIEKQVPRDKDPTFGERVGWAG